MKEANKKTEEILTAARKAAAKINDPALRARATAKLDATQKKLTTSRQQQRSLASNRLQTREHELDSDR